MDVAASATTTSTVTSTSSSSSPAPSSLGATGGTGRKVGRPSQNEVDGFTEGNGDGDPCYDLFSALVGHRSAKRHRDEEAKAALQAAVRRAKALDAAAAASAADGPGAAGGPSPATPSSWSSAHVHAMGRDALKEDPEDTKDANWVTREMSPAAYADYCKARNASFSAFKFQADMFREWISEIDAGKEWGDDKNQCDADGDDASVASVVPAGSARDATRAPDRATAASGATHAVTTPSGGASDPSAANAKALPHAGGGGPGSFLGVGAPDVPGLARTASGSQVPDSPALAKSKLPSLQALLEQQMASPAVASRSVARDQDLMDVKADVLEILAFYAWETVGLLTLVGLAIAQAESIERDSAGYVEDVVALASAAGLSLPTCLASIPGFGESCDPLAGSDRESHEKRNGKAPMDRKVNHGDGDDDDDDDQDYNNNKNDEDIGEKGSAGRGDGAGLQGRVGGRGGPSFDRRGDRSSRQRREGKRRPVTRLGWSPDKRKPLDMRHLTEAMRLLNEHGDLSFHQRDKFKFLL